MERHEMSDEQLLQLFIEGNKGAIETLIKRHKRRIYSYIFILVKDQKLAEDFFQDTFVKAVKSIQTGSYKDDGKFLSWILRIAHNLVIYYYRKQKNYKEISNERGGVDLFNDSRLCETNIEDKLLQKQASVEVREMIQRLPEEQRELVVMRIYMDMSFKEIAETTGVSINTALGRMRYAIINMRKMMKEKNIQLR